MVSLLDKRHIRKAKFWEPVKDKPGYVYCYLCHRKCIIAPDKHGVCGVRKNINGTLYTLVYGLISAINIDPIEKKPLMHYMPTSEVLSISTVGCNFFCQFCQNWEISQSRLEKGLYGRYMPPEEIVETAIREGADGISYTYNEPTIFYELMYDTAKKAKDKGLFNTMVTNGYITPQAIDELAEVMDAATVDFKASGNKEFYRKYMFVPDPEPIYETLLAMKEKKMFIEITNLIVPRIGDDITDFRKLVKWIIDNLGPETPFHLLRFHPDFRMNNIPSTPVETLENMADIANKEGLSYIYIGNVWGHPLENTYCPKCGKTLIKRKGFFVEEINLTDDARCPYCGYKQNIVPPKKRKIKKPSFFDYI